MLKKTILYTLLLLSSVAQAQLLPNIVASPKGNLSLEIVASDSPKYIKEWISTKPENAITIKRLKQAKPNQLIVIAFLTSGLSADSNGKYHYSVNVYILAPNNEPIWGQRNYAGGKGLLPKKPMIMMADPALDFVLESSDPAGEYTIVAQVTDHVSGVKTDGNYKILYSK